MNKQQPKFKFGEMVYAVMQSAKNINTKCPTCKRVLSSKLSCTNYVSRIEITDIRSISRYNDGYNLYFYNDFHPEENIFKTEEEAGQRSSVLNAKLKGDLK